MGILPLELIDAGPDELAPTGAEQITITGLGQIGAHDVQPMVTVTNGDRSFRARARLDTPREIDYFRHGGVMPYVLRGLLNGGSQPVRTEHAPTRPLTQPDSESTAAKGALKARPIATPEMNKETR
jgi:hypothetical protein